MIIKGGDTYTYNGGYKVINDYQQGEVVALASDFTGINLNENDFFINSSSGQLEIQNVRNKFVGYALNSSEVIAYSYMANDGGIIDGRDKNVLQVMTGANNADNQIYAGNAGSSLWGGMGGNDTLIGGEGTDEFFYASGSGSDVIENVDDNDVVNLLGVSLSQITYASVEDSKISADFADGGHLEINSSSAVGFKVEGVTYVANRTDGSWSTK